MFRTALMLVKRVPSPICTGKSLVSIRTVPAGIGLMVDASTPATCSSFRPAATALARSTLTCTTGWLAARLVATSVLPGTPVHRLDHGIAGRAEVRGVGGLERDVHGGRRAETALLGTDGDLARVGDLGEFGADGLLEPALVGFLLGHHGERGIGGAAGESVR